VRGRDFYPDGEIGAVEVRVGDRCARCGGELEIARGIELGPVFQLGRKYANTFGLTALGADGKPVTITMGSYGVGITRIVAAIAEQTHDEKGLCWPREIAPADVHLVATGKDDTVFAAADEIAAELEQRGVRVLYDDRRGVSPGVKFKDAELLGVPSIVIVGKGLESGVVELKDRRCDERTVLPVTGAGAAIVAAIA
jgi:prolyl-tRNA synthetase